MFPFSLNQKSYQVLHVSNYVNDSRINVSTNKLFLTKDDDLVVHVWFDSVFSGSPILSIVNPNGIIIDSTVLTGGLHVIETFCFTCGVDVEMKDSGYYTIRVGCDESVSETKFEYHDSRYEFNKSDYLW